MTPRYRHVAEMFELTSMLLATTTGVTLEQIAERFEISRRTAERMLRALREMFPEIESTDRVDRIRYWRLPPSSTGALAVLSDVAELSQRVERMEFEIADVRAGAARNNAIVDDALAKSHVGIFILDSDYKVVWTNEALRKYFGLKAEHVHGRDKRELLRARIRDIVEDGDAFEQRVLSTYADNTYVARFDCVIKAGEGRSSRRLQHWSQPIGSGPYQGGRIEHYIDLSSGETPSARPVGEFARNGSIGLGTPTSSEFDLAADVVHSVRNPLANMMAAAESALAGVVDPTEALEQILRSGQRISNVIRDTLRLVREHELTLEAVDVSDLLHEAVDETRWMAKGRGIALDAVGLPFAHSIVADRALIAVALVDLIRNSIEATDGDGRVGVWASRSEDGKSTYFIVSDSGPGFSDDTRSRATKLHYSTKDAGTGLGLAIVNQIVEAHGGNLTIKSRDGGGAMVRIELPNTAGGEHLALTSSGS